MREIKLAFFIVLFTFLGLFVFTKLLGPIPFSVNSVTTTKTDLFTVNGTGEVTAIPDTALLTLGVNKQATSVEDAKNQVNQIINKITADIKALGVNVKDIKTTNYSVNPNYDYSGGRQSSNGYTVDANIEIKVSPIDKANNAIDVATKDGATQVGNVQFVLADDEQQKLEDQARSEAIKNAKTKAQSIANAAGLHLGRIVNIQEGAGSPPPLMYAAGADLKQAAGSEPTQLNPGENKVSVSVTLSYETY
jgi:uncharacterized protein